MTFTIERDDPDTDRLLESLLVHPREELLMFLPIPDEEDA